MSCFVQVNARPGTCKANILCNCSGPIQTGREFVLNWKRHEPVTCQLPSGSIRVSSSDFETTTKNYPNKWLRNCYKVRLHGPRMLKSELVRVLCAMHKPDWHTGVLHLKQIKWKKGGKNNEHLGFYLSCFSKVSKSQLDCGSFLCASHDATFQCENDQVNVELWWFSFGVKKTVFLSLLELSCRNHNSAHGAIQT